MVTGGKMLWMLIGAVLCSLDMEVSGQCWESPECQDLSSDESMLECIQLCKSDLTEESPVYPGEGHLQPPETQISELESEIGLPLIAAGTLQDLPKTRQINPREEPKRSYSMGHFRWGKPVGRKRRPIKVQNNSMKMESAEEMPGEMRRSAIPNDVDYGLAAGDLEESALAGLLQQKKDGSYKMNHFRWGAPPASKRYGGFMKSWDERSQKPLLTLFKNVINKNGQQKKDE